MGRLKTLAEKMMKKSVVRKHCESGRVYNGVDGQGWNHYTKGFRRHSTSVKVMSEGYNKLMEFLAIPFKESEKDVQEKLDKTLETLKGEKE